MVRSSGILWGKLDIVLIDAGEELGEKEKESIMPSNTLTRSGGGVWLLMVKEQVFLGGTGGIILG